MIRWTFLRTFNANVLSGSHRFNRILAAVKVGADAVPMDLRYVSQPRSKLHGESSTAHVVSYLQGLYDSVAETLPDVKDDGVIMELHDGPNPGADTYAESLSSGKVYGRKRVRTRKWKMSLKLHQERRADVSGKEVRHLPPGVMQDHWQTMRALGGPALHISFKHFWTVWHQEFPFLRFRSTSNHAQCSQCLHHKLVIRELHAHMAARQKQAELLRHHLMAQYRDRLALVASRHIPSRMQQFNLLHPRRDGSVQVPLSEVCFDVCKRPGSVPKTQASCCWLHHTWMGGRNGNIWSRPKKRQQHDDGNSGLPLNKDSGVRCRPYEVPLPHPSGQHDQGT